MRQEAKIGKAATQDKGPRFPRGGLSPDWQLQAQTAWGWRVILFAPTSDPPRVMIGPVQGVQTAALKPPPNSGTFPPIVIGMTPEIGPPLAAEAGV